jgi:hypothetical protein
VPSNSALTHLLARRAAGELSITQGFVLSEGPRSRAMNTDRMKAAFNLFDQDGDGYITSDQLKNIFKTLGKAADDSDLRTLISGDVEGMFTARGGQIDYETFVNIYVRRTLSLGDGALRHSLARECYPPVMTLIVAIIALLTCCRTETSSRSRSQICRRHSSSSTKRAMVTLRPTSSSLSAGGWART